MKNIMVEVNAENAIELKNTGYKKIKDSRKARYNQAHPRPLRSQYIRNVKTRVNLLNNS